MITSSSLSQPNLDSSSPSPTPPDPEVVPQRHRRSFTAEYRLRILKEADACTQPGEIGALLRREGLYSSHLVDWRRQREMGALQGLSSKRGRKPKHPAEAEVARLRERTAKLEAEPRRLHGSSPRHPSGAAPVRPLLDPPHAGRWAAAEREHSGGVSAALGSPLPACPTARIEPQSRRRVIQRSLRSRAATYLGQIRGPWHA